MSYTARFIVNIRSVAGLIPGVFQSVASLENQRKVGLNILAVIIKVVFWYLFVTDSLYWFR